MKKKTELTKKSKLHAILHNYEFDNTQMPSSKTLGSQSTIKSLLDGIQQYPEEESLYVKNKWQLSGLPETQIVRYEPPIQTEDYFLAAEINYKHTTELMEPRMRFTSKLMLFTSLWSIVGVILLILVFGQRPETNDCTIQFLNGKPHSIVVDTTEYKLQSDGTLSHETRMFLNPWHQQAIESGQCTHVQL